METNCQKIELIIDFLYDTNFYFLQVKQDKYGYDHLYLMKKLLHSNKKSIRERFLNNQKKRNHFEKEDFRKVNEDTHLGRAIIKLYNRLLIEEI